MSDVPCKPQRPGFGPNQPDPDCFSESEQSPGSGFMAETGSSSLRFKEEPLNGDHTSPIHPTDSSDRKSDKNKSASDKHKSDKHKHKHSNRDRDRHADRDKDKDKDRERHGGDRHTTSEKEKQRDKEKQKKKKVTN